MTAKRHPITVMGMYYLGDDEAVHTIHCLVELQNRVCDDCKKEITKFAEEYLKENCIYLGKLRDSEEEE